MLLSLEILTEQMRKLPGVGAKTAMKYALSILEMEPSQAQAFVSAIEGARCNIRRCERCFHLSEGILCSVCEDNSRSDKEQRQADPQGNQKRTVPIGAGNTFFAFIFFISLDIVFGGAIQTVTSQLRL